MRRREERRSNVRRAGEVLMERRRPEAGVDV